jgi:intracellular septation protein
MAIKRNSYMCAVRNTLVEVTPLIVFFVVERQSGFFDAVTATAVATLLSLLVAWLTERRVPWFALIGGVSLMFFAALSLVFRDDDFFILQDSLTDLVLALALLVSYVRNLHILKRMFSPIFAITDRGWHILELRWGLLMLVLGIGNEIVRLMGTTDDWVLYRALSIGLIVLFGIWQFRVSRRERTAEGNYWGVRKQPGDGARH